MVNVVRDLQQKEKVLDEITILATWDYKVDISELFLGIEEQDKQQEKFALC